jgi:hypothetical protein
VIVTANIRMSEMIEIAARMVPMVRIEKVWYPLGIPLETLG